MSSELMLFIISYLARFWCLPCEKLMLWFANIKGTSLLDVNRKKGWIYAQFEWQKIVVIAVLCEELWAACKLDLKVKPFLKKIGGEEGAGVNLEACLYRFVSPDIP